MGDGTGQLGVAQRASRSRVEWPAGNEARLFSALPPCFLTCRPTIASITPRWSASRSSRSMRWSASACPYAGPGLKGGDELDLVDQAVLQREQAKEEVT